MDLALTSFLEGSFSILVAAFLLLRMEKRMDELTKAINLLRHCQTCKHSPYIFVTSPGNNKPDDYDLDYKALPDLWGPAPTLASE